MNEERKLFLKKEISILEDEIKRMDDIFTNENDPALDSMLNVYHDVKDKLNKYNEELISYE